MCISLIHSNLKEHALIYYGKVYNARDCAVRSISVFPFTPCCETKNEALSMEKVLPA